MVFTERKVSHETVVRMRKYMLTFAFLFGFVVDNFTLNRVDQFFDNFVLASYVTLAMISMWVLYAAAADRLPESAGPFLKKYAPYVTQFAFGGLLSGMLIFYGRSGSWLESWPFLLMIIVVIFGNETIHDRVQRLLFNVSVLFIGLFAYTVLLIPVLTGKMGSWIFIGSGLLAVFIMFWFLRILGYIVPRFMEIHMRTIVFTLGCIYATFNFLYFTNIIPPIPLSLKEVGIYHSVVKFGSGEYQLTYEKPKWWQSYKDSNTDFLYKPGDNIFCFASVFAPTRLATDVYHTWEYYNQETGTWEERNRISYPISGGRDGGFRGFTLIKNYQEGVWRCTVETGRGQVLGSVKFEVKKGTPSDLVTRIE